MATAESTIFWLLRFYHFATAHLPIIRLLQIEKYSTNGNRLNICLLCIEKLYYNYKCPIWNVSTIYMATAQSSIFSLLRIYHFASAHLPIIYLVQIDQLFQHWEWSKYLIIVYRKIVWQLQIAYLEILRRFIWLLRKAQFIRYCSSYNHFATAHLPNICLLQIDNLFQHWKSSTYLVTLRRKIVWQLRIAYLEIYQWFIWLIRKANF